MTREVLKIHRKKSNEVYEVPGKPCEVIGMDISQVKDHYLLFELIDSLLIIGMMPLVGSLNNSSEGLSSPDPSRVNLICNKAICISDLASMHF